MSNRRFLVCVLILGALLRVGVFLIYQPWSEDSEARFVCDDAVGYWNLAKNITHHGVFSRMDHEPLVPDALRTPGYPFFIAAICRVFGFHVAPVFIVQGLLSLGVIYLLYKACAIILDEWTARIAAILSAVDIYAIEYNNMLWTESLSLLSIAVLLLLVALILKAGVVRWQMNCLLFLLGAVTGISVLVHPRASNLIVALILMLLIARMAKQAIIELPLRRLSWIIAGWLIVMSPWLIRNFVVYGSVGISTANDLGLYFAELPATMARVDHISFREAQRKYGAPEEHGGGVGSGAMSFADGAYYRRYSLGYLQDHPLDAAIAHAQGMARMFRRVDGMIGGNCERPTNTQIEYYKVFKEGGVTALWNALKSDQQPLNSVFFSFHLVLLMMLYAGTVLVFCFFPKLSPTQRVFVLFVAAVALYFNLLTGPLGGVRHRIPMQPALEILAAIGIGRVRMKMMRRGAARPSLV